MRVLAMALLALAACGGEAADPRGAVIAAWQAKGLKTSPLEAAPGAVGPDCKTTHVNALEVLLCSYKTPAEAKAAEEAGYAWVGEATGAVKASASVLVAVADRRKTDPSGKTINQLIKLAPK